MSKLPFDQKGAIGIESLKWTALNMPVHCTEMFVNCAVMTTLYKMVVQCTNISVQCTDMFVHVTDMSVTCTSQPDVPTKPINIY